MPTAYKTYTLCFEVGTSIAVHVFVEVLQLQCVELLGNLLDRCIFFARDGFDSRGIPRHCSVYAAFYAITRGPSVVLPTDQLLRIVTRLIARFLILGLPLLAFSGRVRYGARHDG